MVVADGQFLLGEETGRLLLGMLHHVKLIVPSLLALTMAGGGSRRNKAKARSSQPARVLLSLFFFLLAARSLSRLTAIPRLR